MAITRTPMVDDDGTGTTGTVINNAWKTELYNQIDAADLAAVTVPWVNVAYSAANFTASSGTWTVEAADVQWYQYLKLGNLAVVSFSIFNSTTSAATTQVILAVPSVIAAPAGIFPIALIRGRDAGAQQVALAELVNDRIRIEKLAGGTWAAQTNALLVSGTMVYQIP